MVAARQGVPHDPVVLVGAEQQADRRWSSQMEAVTAVPRGEASGQHAFSRVYDATLTAKTPDGVIAAGYADAVMTRYIVEKAAIRDDLLTRNELKAWVDGLGPPHSGTPGSRP
jgi:hypothetical protein